VSAAETRRRRRDGSRLRPGPEKPRTAKQDPGGVEKQATHRQRRRRKKSAWRIGPGVRGQSPRFSVAIENVADAHHEVYRVKLPREVARYIDSLRWDWFTTHTLIRNVRPDVAVRTFEVWIARLSEACANSRRRQSVTSGPLVVDMASGQEPRTGQVRGSPAVQHSSQPSHAATDARVREPQGQSKVARGRSVLIGTGLLRWVLAAEWTKAQRVHLHAVISGDGLDRLPRRRWGTRWESLGLSCGMARIFAQRGRASEYLAKEIGKGGVFVMGGPFARRLAVHTRSLNSS
jgi:hypothetical protein